MCMGGRAGPGPRMPPERIVISERKQNADNYNYCTTVVVCMSREITRRIPHHVRNVYGTRISCCLVAVHRPTQEKMSRASSKHHGFLAFATLEY